jgi:ferredoxin
MGFTITYPEELTHGDLQVSVDWIVVDEAIEPGHHLQEPDLASSKSMRRPLVSHKAIMYAAGATPPTAGDLCRRRFSGHVVRPGADVGCRSGQFTRFILFRGCRIQSHCRTSVIRMGRCARCLTCHRLCPHKAIDIGPRITVVRKHASAAVSALRDARVRPSKWKARISAPKRSTEYCPHTVNNKSQAPRIVVFGCSRSAGRANALIRMSGRRCLQESQIIEVPCAGTIAGKPPACLSKPVQKGCMLCTCHTGNCQSEVGNQVAKSAPNHKPVVGGGWNAV